MAIVLNLILRILWTLTISPASIGIFLNPIFFAAILSGFEIFRRGMWNLIRLENEQLNNMEKFRVVRDIPVPIQKRAHHRYHHHGAMYREIEKLE